MCLLHGSTPGLDDRTKGKSPLGAKLPMSALPVAVLSTKFHLYDKGVDQDLTGSRCSMPFQAKLLP